MCLSVSIGLSVSLFVYLLVCPPVHTSVCLCLYLYVCLPVCLPICSTVECDLPYVTVTPRTAIDVHGFALWRLSRDIPHRELPSPDRLTVRCHRNPSGLQGNALCMTIRV